VAPLGAPDEGGRGQANRKARRALHAPSIIAALKGTP
jgi:hypothetical protein